MGRAPCCDQSGLKKGPWTPEEDLKLIKYIEEHGPGNWRALPKNAGLERCGKSCRLRWTNYLRPDIKRGRFTFEEEETIIQLHGALGNKWSAIAASLPGRTDNEIKNYWNTHVKKRLLRSGIDPVTHAPRLDLSSILTSSTNLLNLFNAQTLLNPEMIRLASAMLLLKRGHLGLFPETQQNPQPLHVGDISPEFLRIPDLTANSNSFGDHGGSSVTIPVENVNLACDNQNLRVDNNSLLSTPLMCNGADLFSSSSALMNNGTTEDDYCSNFLHFEIPEGLDMSEFL